MLDRDTNPEEVAWKIYDDKLKGTPPQFWIDMLSIVKEISVVIAEYKKIPDTKNREHEFCVKCNYPKYKDEDCRFCK
ncbi:hypothetical protein H1230_13290 [Paenibacillus sp. 19GGS1-52]|uniref:hypothetical protein n=1 Tax=Paenibacillus sp. 19GGS1-52 TaxID=2758563 RepID=UPI001EFBEF63|nr:hypothetical protein [Paenibacillus sp. 19GGS1-52]ULO09655.1 hypothetical protein H1230_13290 [Paenibacillus sp. 19GGS1-52]